jgi:alpha-ketoglutarate-dependent taurine dioxygenase
VLKEIEIEIGNPEKGCNRFLEFWKTNEFKIFKLTLNKRVDDIRSFYESIFTFIGIPKAIAEDASIKDRSKQRTGKIWIPVCYDPSYSDAYRHSNQNQPLHTDFSYISNSPNASLFCCIKNIAKGGETIFLDSNTLSKILLKNNENLFNYLTKNDIEHIRSGDKRVDKILKKHDDKWYVNWNYYCVNDKNSKILSLKKEQFQDFIMNNKEVKENILMIRLKESEALIWKDNELLHGRNSFIADSFGDRFIWKCAIEIGLKR